MTRFSGKVGFVQSVLTDDVFEDVVTERPYRGDRLRQTRYFAQGETILGKVSFQTRISIVADAFALENFDDIRYVVQAGVPWIVETVDDERPRLTLVLGEKYNGPRPEETP